MTDYINRDALLKELMLDPIGRMLIKRYNLDGFIKAQPKAEPVRHGKWSFKGYGYDRSGIHYPFWDRYTCSVCGKESDNTPYCPYCGAKMDGEQP